MKNFFCPRFFRYSSWSHKNVDFHITRTESCCRCTYFSIFSSSLSSTRLRGLPTVKVLWSTSAPDGGLAAVLNGVEVKHIFGLEFGRSALTGVGFILLDGLVPLKNDGHCYDKSQDRGSSQSWILFNSCVDSRRWDGWWTNNGKVL